MSDIQKLFAALNVKPRESAAESSSQQSAQPSFFPNNSASAATSPPPQPFQPFGQAPSQSNFTTTPAQVNGAANNERAQSLLSLLNFGRPASAATSQPAPLSNTEPIARPVSQNVIQPDQRAPDQTSNPQDALLKLLNASHSLSAKPSQDISGMLPVSTARLSGGGGRESSATPNSRNGGERRSSPVRMFGTSENKETTPFEAPKPEVAGPSEAAPLIHPQHHSRTRTQQPQLHSSSIHSIFTI